MGLLQAIVSMGRKNAKTIVVLPVSLGGPMASETALTEDVAAEGDDRIFGDIFDRTSDRTSFRTSVMFHLNV